MLSVANLVMWLELGPVEHEYHVWKVCDDPTFGLWHD